MRVFVTAHGHDPPPTVTLTYGFVDRDAGRARELGSQYARAYRLSAIDHYELGSDAEEELEAFAGAQLWGTPDQVVEKAAYLAERDAHRPPRLRVPLRGRAVRGREARACVSSPPRSLPRLREIPVP